MVVGGGAAGLATALSAASRGSSVILIEKAPAIGGTTAKSDGAYWVPNNHLMRRAGVADPKDDAIRYMVRASYPALYRDDDAHWGVGEQEYALIEAYYDLASGSIEALEAMGAIVSTTVALPDYLDHVPTNKPMRHRILVPKKGDSFGNGRELIRQLRAKVETMNIEVLPKHAATRILRNARGEVVGLTVKSGDAELQFRAKKAVVLDRQGFNRAMVAATSRLIVLADYTKWGVVGLCAMARLADASVLVSDEGLSTEARDLLSTSVGELILAGPGEGIG